MTTMTIKKWGNSQGILIPKNICRELGIDIGDKLNVFTKDGKIELVPGHSTHKRSRNVSAAELFDSWDGTYNPPADLPCTGNELDWGSPVGKEAW